MMQFDDRARTWLAGQALHGIVAANVYSDCDEMAARAVQIADATIKALNQPQPEPSAFVPCDATHQQTGAMCHLPHGHPSQHSAGHGENNVVWDRIPGDDLPF